MTAGAPRLGAPVTGGTTRVWPAPGLGRVALVSAVVTALDVSVLAGLRRAGVPLPAADAGAVGVASVASYRLHGRYSFGGDAVVRWVDQPAAFAVIALGAGALDVAVTARAGKARGLLAAAAVRLVAYRTVLWTRTRRSLATRAARPAPAGARRLSVIVPAYREADRIAGTVRRLQGALAGVDAEVVVVDDGSDDATSAAAEAAGARLVRLAANRGKGAAVRAGVAAAEGRTVAFLDADLAYPPEQVLDLLTRVEEGWDVVVGSRRHPASTDRAGAPMLRTLSGRAFNLLTALVLLGRYRDTQCGLKAFRADAAARLFRAARLDGFAFDVEVLHLVERYGLSLTEVPVTLVAAPGSTVRVGPDALRMVRDLFRVRRWAAEGRYA